MSISFELKGLDDCFCFATSHSTKDSSGVIEVSDTSSADDFEEFPPFPPRSTYIMLLDQYHSWTRATHENIYQPLSYHAQFALLMIKRFFLHSFQRYWRLRHTYIPKLMHMHSISPARIVLVYKAIYMAVTSSCGFAFLSKSLPHRQHKSTLFLVNFGS